MDTLCMFNADIKPNSNVTVIQLLLKSINLNALSKPLTCIRCCFNTTF